MTVTAAPRSNSARHRFSAPHAAAQERARAFHFACARLTADAAPSDVSAVLLDELNALARLIGILTDRGWKLEAASDRAMVWQRSGREGSAVIRMTWHGFILVAEQILERDSAARSVALRSVDIVRKGRRLTRLERV
jgi:hypothetical protein